MDSSAHPASGTAKPGYRRWRTATLYLLTGVGVLVCLLLSKELIFPITAAIALAVVLRQPRAWLHKKMSPSLTSVTLLCALGLAVLLPGFFVVRSLTGEVITVINFVRSGAASQEMQQLAVQHPKAGSYLQKAVEQLAPGGGGKRLATTAAGYVGLALQHFANGVTEMVLALFLLFFLLRDQEQALSTLRKLIPLDDGETQRFLAKLGDLVYAVFAGRFLIAGFQGLLAGLAYWVLGVPGALLWGVITVICCLIPAFGSFLAWIPIAIYLGLAVSWTKAAILAAWGGIVVGNVDNVLYPMLVGRRTSLHTAIIFVAIFGGVALFGLSGFVIGPVLVSATMLLLIVWKERLGTTSNDNENALGGSGSKS